MTTYKLYNNPLDSDARYWTLADTKKTLSYGATYNTLMSPRNVGKSYSCMQLANQELEKGNSVAWGRYNKIELGASIKAWTQFNPDLVPVKNEGSTLKTLVDSCTGGRLTFFTWSVSQNLKGIDEPYKYIICDEFIPDRYTNKTRLDTEFDDWSSVYFSLARDYKPKVIMLSNCIYWMNPFYERWNICPFAKGKTLAVKDILTADIDGETVKSNRRVVSENIGMSKTMIKRTIEETNVMFASSSEMQHYYNNQTKAEYTKIAKCPDMTVPLDYIQLMSDGYYMGTRSYDGMLYVSKIRPDLHKETAVSEPEYIDITKRHYRGKSYVPYYEDAFNAGMCAFDSSETLTHFLRWIRHMRRFL